MATPASTCWRGRTRSWRRAEAGRWSPPGWRWPSPRASPASCCPAAAWPLRHGLTVVNAPGLIDAGYRDEVKVILLNTDPEHEHRVLRGERIAQLVIQRVETALLVEVETLPGSSRGGGFGHTGS